ncbi:MAG: hypothetical protein RIM84_23080 [Alphaproteobacteria bacterium]
MARYVQRDIDGRIIAAFATEQPGAGEALADDHPDLVAFLLGIAPGEPAATLLRSDLEMARVVEDMIEVLIRRNVIQITDFPEVVRDKLLRRRQDRGRLAGIADLMPDADDQIL